MKTSIRFSLAAILGLGGMTCLLAGCAHTYRMHVDGAARPDAAAHVSYVVREAALADLPTGHSADAAKYVRTALSAKGMFEAPNPERAEMDVTYSYEIERRLRHREWDETEFQIPPLGGFGSEPLNLTAPTRVKAVHHSAEEIAYAKSLHLVATERKPASADTPAWVWDISIGYEDDSPDMEKAMPLLAAAGCDLIGRDTHGPVIVRLHDKDEVVAFIKRGLN